MAVTPTVTPTVTTAVTPTITGARPAFKVSVGREGAAASDAWFSRLEIAQKERKASRRLVLMYGCEVAAGKGNASKATWFVNLVESAILSREAATPAHQAGRPSPRVAVKAGENKLIDTVQINTAPAATTPPEDSAPLSVPDDERLGYTVSKSIAATRTDPLPCEVSTSRRRSHDLWGYRAAPLPPHPPPASRLTTTTLEPHC